MNRKEKLLRRLNKPLYIVVFEWDGCWSPEDGTLYGPMPLSSCKEYMRGVWRKYNRDKGSLGLISQDTGRMVSYIL